MEEYFHSVKLNEEKCKGCTNCIKRCPTEAIRVRKSKARIINERCIDCGECIRVCPHHAKLAVTDSPEMITKFKYNAVIPAPSLYGQFKPEFTRNDILCSLATMGFDEVYEVANGAEIITRETKKLIKKNEQKKPLISSACPAVVRLIQVRFPNLIDNIVKLESPMEVSAKIVKERIAKRKGLKPEEIGVFFITPCAAKATSVKAPYEKDKSSVDGVISIKDIFVNILGNMEKAQKMMKSDNLANDLETAGFKGISWANAGGEATALGTDKYLAVDGIHNVITILEEIENDKLEDIDFIEALACTGGCLGGPLTVENMYVAKTRLKKHIERAKENSAKFEKAEKTNDEYIWTGKIEHRPVLKLDSDFATAMKKLEELETICNDLPGLDCGSCGAPSCRALAEDIVRGIANETDCIFKLRDKVRMLAGEMIELEEKMPPVLDREKKKEE